VSPPAPLLPFEFTVRGVPVSYQSANRAALVAWQQAVRAAAAAGWGSSPAVTSRLSVIVEYLHDGTNARIDLDNLLKPVLDALNGLVYADDGLIVTAKVKMTPLDDPIKARYASPVLLQGFSVGAPFIYVRIEVAPGT
jgi:crossover junction endodeoxyribonuclease RusA